MWEVVRRFWKDLPSLLAGRDVPGHDGFMRSRHPWILLALLCSGCGDDARTSSWSYGPSDAGVDGSDAVSVDGSTEEDVSADVGPDVPSDGVANEVGPEAAPPPQGPALYPSDRTHSPLTPFVAGRLKDVVGNNQASRKDLFIKVGDSITVSTRFLHCFADGQADLGEHGALQGVLDAYASAEVLGTTPFDRISAAVEGGRTASWAMTGSPSPLDLEVSAVNPAVAVVMFGTNDIGWFGDDHAQTLRWYHEPMFDLVDRLIAAGVVPILSTIPPRDDAPSHGAWVSMFNAVIRGMAQGRQVPLVDYHRELVVLPSHGLSSDGVHPNAFSGDSCLLTAEGLAYGYNARNLVTLEALDRVWRAVIQDEGAPDDSAPALAGTGTATDPFVVTGPVFTDVRSTEGATSDVLDVYDCSGADESGPEQVYRLEVATSVRLRAVVLDRGNVDVDLHLLGGTVGETGCVARGDTLVESDLSPGTYHLVVDTYASGGQALAGEYLLAVELN